MKKVVSGVLAGCLSLGIVGSAISASNAAPLLVVKPEASSRDLKQAQFRRNDDRSRFERPRYERRFDRPRFERRGDWSYYNGHRGYREYRRGYRQYNGWWFPPAAFVAGAIIGGAIVNQPVIARPAYAPVRLSAAHVNWCGSRWKSYRVSDNSYQPLSGPRQVCVSPYGG
ncbi:BA14K family protein [Microvirga sp. ACRRW]|uniref:BA14K family protein n=1 Tax=Microvirga sp. ACRRW TaxID=2918205 RepID=UPI001EF71DCB|nr:BA14K family protein [Microvirga sp. ACRRW]MCG7391623.1 BA14K family protein [Microvirga sp. ACRRW]